MDTVTALVDIGFTNSLRAIFAALAEDTHFDGTQCPFKLDRSVSTIAKRSLGPVK